jgi:hypothetical protein
VPGRNWVAATPPACLRKVLLVLSMGTLLRP